MNNGAFGTPIARRLLRASDGGAIEVILGRPRYVGRRWQCPFRFRGTKEAQVLWGVGIDAFQALYSALEGIRVKLRELGCGLSVPGTDPPYLGFPMFIPEVLGLDVYADLERMVERRIEQFVRKFERDFQRRSEGS